MNALACKCGTATADCPKDNTCDLKTNKCGTVAACASVDGKTKSAGICLCGTVGCVKDDYCKSTSDSCFKDGASVDDSAINSVTCKCGTEQCDKDTTCAASTNKCTAVPACVDTEGKDKSKVAFCMCGTAACKKDQTCTKADNKCASGLLAGLVALIA
jgi:hypothetical protein